jgi:hypothetical protein
MLESLCELLLLIVVIGSFYLFVIIDKSLEADASGLLEFGEKNPDKLSLQRL